MTDGKDPDEFIKAKGRDAYLELVDAALPYGDFKIHRVAQTYDLTDEQQRLDYLREIVGVLQSMKPMEADLYISKIAEQTGISPQAIRLEYESGRQEQPVRTAPPREENREELSEAEKNLLRLMIMDLKYTEIPQDIHSEIFRGGDGAQLYQLLQQAAAGGRTGPADLRELSENIEPELADLLERVGQVIIPAEKEQIVFDECVAHIRRQLLQQRDQEITWMLSLDDGTLSEEELRDLMKEQAQIQKKMKGQGI